MAPATLPASAGKAGFSGGPAPGFRSDRAIAVHQSLSSPSLVSVCPMPLRFEADSSFTHTRRCQIPGFFPLIFPSRWPHRRKTLEKHPNLFRVSLINFFSNQVDFKALYFQGGNTKFTRSMVNSIISPGFPEVWKPGE